MTSAPTQVSDDDAKEAYLKRCMDMTHGQLYAELMRVHREATLLVQAAVEQEREECAKLCDEIDSQAWKEYKDSGKSKSHSEGVSDGANACAVSIRSRGDHGNNT